MFSFFIVIFTSLIRPILSVHETFSTVSTGQFADNVISSFGLARGGLINAKYDVSIGGDLSSSDSLTVLSNSYILMLVLNSYEVSNFYQSFGSSATSPSDYCNKPSFYRHQILSLTGHISLNISETLGQDDQYSLVLVQCRKFTQYSDYPISISISADMKNPQPSGTDYAHLSIDEVMILRVLEGEIIIYCLFIAAMMVQYYLAKRFLKNIHYLFTVTLFFQLLYVISQYVGKFTSFLCQGH